MEENKTAIKELLKNGEYVIYKTTGKSMKPFLKQNRDIVRIAPKNGLKCKINDVVLFLRDDGSYVLHRILKNKNGKYWIVGDHCVHGEEVSEDQIIGILTDVNRNGKEISLEAPLYRLYVLIWCKLLLPFRFLFGRMYVDLKYAFYLVREKEPFLLGINREKFNKIVNGFLDDTVKTIDIRGNFWGYIRSLNKYIRTTKPDRFILTKEMKKDYIKYYKSFGFRHIRTDWLEYIYSLTGKYDRRYVPDDLFNLYIDNPYDTERLFWQNKAFQPRIIPEAKYPDTVIKRLNGIYFDAADNRITQAKALNLIKEYDEVVLKHVIGGGGLDILFLKREDIDEERLNSIEFDFLVQKVIEQSPLMAQFNDSTVNIVKITSFMFKGELHILSSRIWIGGNDRLSSSSGGVGYQVTIIGEDGQLNDESFNLEGKRIKKTDAGVLLSDIKIDFYKECLDLVKIGHEKLLYFPFISWDFTQDKNGNTILIEYNLKWHVLYDIQLLSGPAFSDFTDEVLKEASKKMQENYSLILK